ncbi:MAG: hypothetical protein NTW55_02805 [Planctomycetota bacterium]|nr:hypothetical protein [Planctomycetota bacterium]
MSTKKKSVQVLIVVVISLFVGMAAKAGDVFEAVPADALFAIRINNYEGTLGQLDQFLAGIAPMPNPAAMMTRMQLANAIGDPNMANVNLKGQMAIFGTAIQKEPNVLPEMFIGFLVPVADYSKFISSNVSATKPDSNGVSTIGRKKMLVMQAGSYAILAPPDKYTALGATVKAAKAKNLTSVLGAANREAAVVGRIWAYGNIEQVKKLYGPMIFAKMDEAQKVMAAKDPNIALAAKGIAIYFEVAKRLMNESKTIMLAANPKPDVLSLTGTFTAIPGTKLAGILESSSADKGTNPLLSYLPGNAVMNMSGHVNKPVMIKMYEELVDIFAPVLGPKFTADEKAKTMNLIKSGVNSLGKTLVHSAFFDPNSKPLFSAMYVFEVADNNAFQKSIDAGIEMMNAHYMQDFLKTFGVTVICDMKRNAEKYKGVSIDVTKVTIKSVDANSQMGQMAMKMYGENIVAKMAIVNGLGLYAVGITADARIKALIDKAKSGEPNTINSEIKNAMALIPAGEQAQFAVTYNYLRLLRMMADFMPGVPFDANALRQIVSKSNIAITGNIGDGAVTLNVAVPKEHVLEIKSAVEMLAPKPAIKPQE